MEGRGEFGLVKAETVGEAVGVAVAITVGIEDIVSAVAAAVMVGDFVAVGVLDGVVVVLGWDGKVSGPTEPAVADGEEENGEREGAPPVEAIDEEASESTGSLLIEFTGGIVRVVVVVGSCGGDRSGQWC